MKHDQEDLQPEEMGINGISILNFSIPGRVEKSTTLRALYGNVDLKIYKASKPP